MKEEYKNSFDSMDVILSVALFGGFWTGNWFPALVLFTIASVATMNRMKS